MFAGMRRIRDTVESDPQKFSFLTCFYILFSTLPPPKNPGISFTKNNRVFSLGLLDLSGVTSVYIVKDKQRVNHELWNCI